MCVYINDALCDGSRRNPPLDMQTIPANNTESASRATEDFLWDPEWVTKAKVPMKGNFILEALHYDIEVPCKSQSQVREQRDTCGQNQEHGQQSIQADV